MIVFDNVHFAFTIQNDNVLTPYSFGHSNIKAINYYMDNIWREFLFTFKKQVGTPRIRIFINNVDETDYAAEVSYNENTKTGDGFFGVGDGISEFEEFVIDRLQIFNKVMVPDDFIGNELVNQSLIYLNIPQLSGI